MKEIAASMLTMLGNPPKTANRPLLEHDNWQVGAHAFLCFGEHAVIFLAEKAAQMRIGVVALREKYLPDGFVGERELLPGGGMLLTGTCERKNAAALRRHCPKCAASTPEIGETPVAVRSFAGAGAEFLLFTGKEADLCILRDQLTFAAFADGMTKKYALGGEAADVGGVARLLDCGATDIVFAPEMAAAGAMPAEYRNKRFVLSAVHAVAIEGETFCGEALRDAEKIARLVAAHHAVYRMRIGKTLSVSEHLVLARELYAKHALPRQIVAAAITGNREDHAAIAARYGKYEFKTVSS